MCIRFNCYFVCFLALGHYGARFLKVIQNAELYLSFLYWIGLVRGVKSPFLKWHSYHIKSNVTL